MSVTTFVGMTKALSRAEAYLNKYGKRGKYYGQVVEIMSRLQMEVEKEVAIGSMVRIPDENYELGKYEVTQGQWRLVMGSNPSYFKNCGDNCPVENVSWNDIQEFIQKLNAKTGKQYRLPTTVEWDYACGGDSKDIYDEKTVYCGSGNADNVAWHKNNSGDTTYPVGLKQANNYGLYDMVGNVNEVTINCYVNSKGKDCNNREYRGGAYDDIPGNFGLVPRYGGITEIGIRYSDIGFRLARTLP